MVKQSDFVKLPGAAPPGVIPNAVVGKRIMDEVSMLQAWREYMMLTQTDMADAWVLAKQVTRRLRPPSVHAKPHCKKPPMPWVLRWSS
ncbi:hypothetical protein Mettu_0604 [Methylobacter tundripaludum SV96]|uniref:Uncharacterized protein n=1 Tax=Methylobacter tundripaludum (strain ATCC BAA-1195 / DSM 17260 / SV96) TaxID=697282 RepID=G3IW05_METTV|nr:hypothetical protein Mettu_0604 [Methylobacter tundripaludum SV96]